MNWLQNSIIVIVCFLLARILIDAGVHRELVHRLVGKSRATISSLITGALLISYFLSMFFPNVVVLLSLLPVVKYILDNIEQEELRRDMATPLALALIYGANIGGMASLIGSPLNLIYVGFIEVHHIPGRENITFFSWLLLGIPVTFVLILISRWILKIGESDCPIPFHDPVDNAPSGSTAQSLRKYVLFFGVNIVFIILLTAAQFFFKPGKVMAGLNLIDALLLGYLGVILFFSFIFPRRGRTGKRSPWKYKKNFVFLLLYVVFFPWIYIVESLKAIRVHLKFKPGGLISRFDRLRERIFQRTWVALFKEDFQDYLESKHKNAFVSIDRLIYDLPFWGLLFMGMVILFIFLVLVIGDNPATPGLDGYVVRFFETAAAKIIPGDNQSLLFLMGIVFISIFMTEFINNATVILIMFPLVLKILSSGHINPLFFLLAVSTAASGAFMMPIATPVNAIAFAGIEGVSLKRMVKNGFILNILSALWLSFIFYILNRLF